MSFNSICSETPVGILGGAARRGISGMYGANPHSLHVETVQKSEITLFPLDVADCQGTAALFLECKELQALMC